MKRLIHYFLLSAALLSQAGDLTPAQEEDAGSITCNNLIYAKDQTSVCFADKFLETAAKQTGIPIKPKFVGVRLDSEALFDSPFTVISGTGSFKFSDKERENLKRYLSNGGFLLASPGCSDATWDKDFRKELKALMPDAPLTKLPMTHALFSTVFKIPSLSLKGGGTALVEGMEINGRLVMIYSSEGLNDSHNAKGCCCCGGDMVLESEKVNVNMLIYALLN